MGPVGHTSSGIAVYLMYCLRYKKQPSLKAMLLPAVCANISDADLIGVVWMGLPKANQLHHTFTHTFAFAILLGLMLAVLGRWVYGKWNFGLGIMTFLYVASHVVCDYFTRDTGFPYGVMLAWPFSDRYFMGPSIFLDIYKSSWQNVFSVVNLKASIHEFLIFSPLISIPLAWLMIRDSNAREISS